MGNIVVEVCLISARWFGKMGISLLRLQWYAVMWIDPSNKYCTKITASGNSNPVWNTKFSVMVDDARAEAEDLVLHIEVYSREPLFLRERLEGEASVALREFLDKYAENLERGCPGAEETCSFQLRKRKRKSDKAQGFIEISIQINQAINAQNSSLGRGEGFQLRSEGRNNTWAGPESRPDGHTPYSYPTAIPQNYTNPSSGGPNPDSYHPPSASHASPPSNFSYHQINHTTITSNDIKLH